MDSEKNCWEIKSNLNFKYIQFCFRMKPFIFRTTSIIVSVFVLSRSALCVTVYGKTIWPSLYLVEWTAKKVCKSGLCGNGAEKQQDAGVKDKKVKLNKVMC